jgi:rod shape-determining protein MreB
MSDTQTENAPNKSAQAAPPKTRQTSKTVLLGFDLGTNKSCVISGSAEKNDIELGKILPSIVGYVKNGVVNGIIPGDADVLFGEQAIQTGLHVDLVPPLNDGVIDNPRAARDFVTHVRSIVDPSGSAEIRTVIGVPANATDQARDDVRHAVGGIFDRLLLIPEPFLAALGVRDDSRLGQSNYVDPVSNSLFVDIGAGSTDLCLVQGYFPTADDQISFPFAGDAIDEQILESINQIYPDCGISPLKVRAIKEEHAYVGPSRKPIDVKVIIGGKSRMLELGDVIGAACNQLFDRIYDGVKKLIGRASNDSVEQLLQNIIITCGGSLIKGIDTELQKCLTQEGFENPKVRLAGADFQRYVAIGALKAARAARENQWQYVLN